MDDVDFNALVTAFDKECRKAGYTRTEVGTVSVASNKRPLAKSSSSHGNYGFGGGSKRGRFYK